MEAEATYQKRIFWTVGIVAGLTALVLIGYQYGITLWDWAKLLLVPAVVAGGGLWFNRQQREPELEIEERRAQHEALQAYLEQMSQLLTDKERPLRRARAGDSLSTITRARTLAVLSRLNESGRGSILRFLYESGLINKDHPVISLERAYLRGIYMDEEEAYLRRANLTSANLHQADLSEAKLCNARLEGALLREATLNETDLKGVDLSRAYLKGVDVGRAYLH